MKTKKLRIAVSMLLMMTMVVFFSVPGLVYADTAQVTYQGGVPQAATYTVGDTVTVAAPPAEYEGWTLNGNDTDLGYNEGHVYVEGETFIMPANNINFKLGNMLPTEYSLTINYEYVGGATAAPSYTDTLASGATYSVASPIIPGFTASQLTVAGTMPAANVTVTVTYTAIPADEYTLTINYIYVGGATAATSYVDTLEAGDPYSVTSPAITGFTADVLVVSGTMPASNVTVTVTYTAIPATEYDLTINYIYVGGATAATSYTDSLEAGELYSVTSPAITGFTASQPVVAGTMPAEDVTVTVTYTAIPPTEYNLTINYVYVGGATAATSYTDSLEAGAAYNVTSPAIAGFTADDLIVTGTMPAANTILTVTYTAIPPTEYNLTINYIYVGGATAAASFTNSLEAGEAYNVTSPAITGFTADDLIVTGTMPAANTTITVTYNAIPGESTYDLGIAKSASRTDMFIGNSVTFTVTITNNGNTTANGIQVNETWPSGLDQGTVTPAAGTTYNDSTNVWNVGTLNPGETKTLTIAATANALGTATNTVSLDMEEGTFTDDNALNNTATASVDVNRNTSGGGGSTTTPTTPITPIPEPEVPLAEPPVVTPTPETVIPEEPAPLSDVPQTSDADNIWMLLGLMLASGLGLGILGRRKETSTK